MLNDLTEEAENSWFNRFLPAMPGERKKKAQQVSEQPVMFTKKAEGKGAVPSFDFDRWAVHRSSSRYTRLILGVLFGKTTQRIAPVVLLVVLFSTAVFSYNSVFLPATQLISIRARYPELQLPLTPFELTAPVLGLLLVFRTDTSYDRFNEGSQLAWEITASMRTHVRRLLAFTGTKAFTPAERDAAIDIITATSKLHGLLMLSYLRGDETSPTEAKGLADAQTEVLSLALGVRPGEDGYEELLGLAADDAYLDVVTPYLCLNAITLGSAQRLTGLTDQERIALDDCLMTVSTDLSKCEKIISTPIPLGYTRSAVRFLWIWLTLLPFALSRTFGDFSSGTWWEDKPLAELPILLASMLFISFIFLSIEDIAVQIEEPFAILPLEVQHQWLMRDAQQARKLSRWYRARPSVDGGDGVSSNFTAVGDASGSVVPSERREIV